jgi:hypothetical protein
MVVAAFLATVASYYHPRFGFTVFLTLPADSQGEYELARVRAVPHFIDPSGGYDGQFYARLAVEPLLRDPAIDKTLDLAPYRARRILFSWTAYAIGLGRPAWILQVFALQNVVTWLVFAWLLLRWFPVGTGRSFGLWAGCLLTHGVLNSVRYALIDGPSTLLLAAAVVAAEAARPWVASLILGVSGLARETNLLGATMLVRFVRRSPRSWLRVGACLVVAALPLLIWLDYLHSIYRGSVLVSGGNVTTPFVGIWWKATTIIRDIHSGGWAMPTISSALALVAFVTQAVYVGWAAIARRAEGSPWLPLAVSFALLAIATHPVVWGGSPGAITRVALPLAIGFNVLARRAPWPWLVLGNLAVVPGVLSFMFRM